MLLRFFANYTKDFNLIFTFKYNKRMWNIWKVKWQRDNFIYSNSVSSLLPPIHSCILNFPVSEPKAHIINTICGRVFLMFISLISYILCYIQFIYNTAKKEKAAYRGCDPTTYTYIGVLYKHYFILILTLVLVKEPH